MKNFLLLTSILALVGAVVATMRFKSVPEVAQFGALGEAFLFVVAFVVLIENTIVLALFAIDITSDFRRSGF